MCLTEEPARTLQRSDTPTKLQVSHGHGDRLAIHRALRWDAPDGTATAVVSFSFAHDSTPVFTKTAGHVLMIGLAAQLNVLYIVLEDFGVLGTSVFKAPVTNDTTPNLARPAGRHRIPQGLCAGAH